MYWLLFDNKKLIGVRNLLAKVLIAGSVFSCLTVNVLIKTLLSAILNRLAQAVVTVVAPKFLGKSSRVCISIDELVQEDSPKTLIRSASARHDNQLNTGTGGRKFAFQLLLFFTLLGGASFAQAVQTPCSAVGGLLDGDVTPVPPANIKIDTNCRIQNYPGGLNTNFSFDNNDPTPYLAIFDNVFLTGQMSCNVVAGHKIWLQITQQQHSVLTVRVS